MENDWEIFDKVKWVKKYFVWLRIFNNFVNMIIYTFWTLSALATCWLFFFTKEMDFYCYVMFLYSLGYTGFFMVCLDDKLYFLDRYLRDEGRRFRIEKLEAAEEQMKIDAELKEVTFVAKEFSKRARKYPELVDFIQREKPPFMVMYSYLRFEEANEAIDLLIQQIIREIYESNFKIGKMQLAFDREQDQEEEKQQQKEPFLAPAVKRDIP
jgi:hypothetical protein